MGETKDTLRFIKGVVLEALNFFLSVWVLYAAYQFWIGNIDRAWFVLALVAVIRLDIIVDKLGTKGG